MVVPMVVAMIADGNVNHGFLLGGVVVRLRQLWWSDMKLGLLLVVVLLICRLILLSVSLKC